MKMNNQTYIIRTQNAGVFFAEIAERDGSTYTLKNARRIYYWNGATECIGISETGVKTGSKITVTKDSMRVHGVIEELPCTETADATIRGIPEWRV